MKKLLSGILVTFALILPQMIQGQNVVTVADGSASSEGVPIYANYCDEYVKSQTIYPASMLSTLTGVAIQGIEYYLNETTSAVTSSFQVKIGTTTSSSFTSDFLSASLTTVYTGAISLSSNTVRINFTTPYTYTGGNLMIEITSTTVSDYEYVTFMGSVASAASIYGFGNTQGDIEVMDIEDFIPKTGFVVPSTGCDMPSALHTTATTSTGIAVSWTAPSNAPAGYAVEYKPTSATTWTRATTTQPRYAITGLSSGTNYNIRVKSLCGADSSQAIQITASTESCNFTVAGGSTTSSYVPFYGFYNYGYSQALYPSSALSDELDTITGIAFNASATNGRAHTIDIYLCNTSRTSLSTSGYEAVGNMTRVVTNKVITFAVGWNYIPFDQPFVYNGTSNLIVAVDNNTGGYSSGLTFVHHSASSGSCVYWYQDGSNINPSSPSASNSSTLSTLPDVQFGVPCGSSECVAPLFSVLSVASTQAELIWDPCGNETSWSLQYKTASASSWTTVGELTVTSYTLTGLNPNTNYMIRVGAVCGSETRYSTVNITTPCSELQLPWSETFETLTSGSSNFPNCWTSITGSNYVENYSYRAHNGSQSMHFSGGTIATPAISTENANELEVSFYMQKEGSSSGTMDVGITTDPTNLTGVQWHPLAFPETSTYYEFLEYLTVPNNATTAYVVFKQTGSSSWYFWLDDLNISVAPPCHKPTGLAVTGVGSTTATLSWNHAGERFEVQYRPVGTNNWQTQTVNSNPGTVTGLDPATNYEFQVRAVCDGGEVSTWSTSAFEVTACEEIIVTPQISHLEDCEESMSNTGLPVCWVQESQSTSYKWNVSEGGYSGKGMYFHGYNGYTSRLISPIFDFSALDNGAQMYLWYNIPQTDDYGDLLNANLKLYYRTSSSAQWTQIPATAMTQTTENWADIEILLPNSANASTYQLAFLATAANDYAYTNAYIDEIVVESQFSCPRPTDVTLDYADATTAIVSWTTTATGNATVKYRRSDAEEDDPWIEVQSNSANSVTLTDLTPKTSYDIYVKVACSETDESPYTRHAYTFWTTCYDNAITAYPWTEGFESGLMCWSQEVLNGDYEWIAQRGDGEPTSHALSNAYAGKKNALFYSPTYVIGNSARLVSPVFDLSNLRNPYLRYAYATTAYDYAGPQQRVLEGSYDNMKLYYRTSATAQWQLLKEYNNATVGWMIDSVALPNTTATYQFSIVATFNGGNGVALDNLKVFRPINSSDDGIDDVSSNLNLSIYPNPTNGNTTISIEGVNGKLNIAVIDINGRTLRSEQVECHDSCVERIDVNGLAKGAYFVKVTGATVNCIRKLIVQ